MKMGIIGAGQIGKALAKKLIKAGYPVILSNSRGMESLQPLVEELGTLATAGTNEDACNADVIILAVMWWHIPDVLNKLKKQLKGKIVIDVSNNFTKDGDSPKLEKPTGVIVAELIPDTKIVKAFNHLFGKWIEAEPIVGNGKRVSFISGDYVSAKEIVGKIITELGFKVIDLGNLEQGGRITDVGNALSGLNLVSYPN
ncbi:NADPH-dependent F420 reductase [Maribacter sp. PR1]|uniref:NADPH-dependent F420 reductase n=1 Tax=Maribacter cobaltidurans TaxID=1178778 RepID=A0ABU7IYC8_9FLAO|nr:MULTISPECIES: NADPH-dependent F420 reductase [Maribacter]MDC6390603.1 NADPH-dependent F420 reductase [Maribacter sp. PR1]MEE1977994.1 NADPH-dependent F420 reductase [Maribacter cobaltidurans]